MTNLFVDAETTGLTGTAKLISLAVIDEQGKAVFDSMFNPEQEVDAEATKVHGFTWDDLKGYPVFKEKSKEVVKQLKGNTLIIHNANFDTRIINTQLLECGLPSLENLGCTIVDTLAIARNTYAGKHTLNALCDRYGVSREERVLHESAIDANLLRECYPHLLAENADKITDCNTLLGTGIGKKLPDSVEELGLQYLEIGLIARILEKEKERIKLKIMAEAPDGYRGTDVSVVYQKRVTMDWEAVTQQFLADEDLTSFQKSSISMYVKPV